jgi:SRSO17 transposase
VPLRSRFARLRLRIARRDFERSEPWPEEWLLIDWPKVEKEPTKYWLSTLPKTIGFARLVNLAQLHWRIERDYQALKQEPGLGHFEGRLAKLPSSRHTLHRRARLPDLRARDDSPSAARDAIVYPKPAVPDGYRPRGAALAA